MTLVREAKTEDLPELAKIAQRAFWETFGDYNTPKNMQSFIDEALTEEVFAKDLAEPKTNLWLGFVGSKLAGYLLCKVDSKKEGVETHHPLELSRLYLAKEFKGQGLGTSLIEKLFELAKSAKQDSIWLSVWEHNYPAKAFYRGFGFKKIGVHEYPVGEKLDIDEIWALPL